MKKLRIKIAIPLSDLAIDAAGVAGAASLVYGAHLIYAPAGFIVAGVELLLTAFVLSRAIPGDARKSDPEATSE